MNDETSAMKHQTGMLLSSYLYNTTDPFQQTLYSNTDDHQGNFVKLHLNSQVINNTN